LAPAADAAKYAADLGAPPLMAKKKGTRVRLVDTTFRDAQQALLGGYLRTEEILPIAAEMDSIGFVAMEAFGGATFETQLVIHEDPWEFLRKLNKATPNTPIQALIRGQNLVARRNFADDVVELFVKHAARSGVDVFRVFDPLNDLRNMEASIAAALKAKKKVQGALCYAISPAHNIELWGSLAKGLVNLGCHEIVIKDTSGLLSPQATWELVTALRHAVRVPIDVHSHCSSGMAPMAYMAAVEAGAEVLDVAMSPLAWGASQPAAESVVAALEGGEYDTGLNLGRMWDAQRDVEELKRRHIEHLSPVADRVDAKILRYHMPGLMIDDILQQLGHQLDERKATARLNEVLDEANHVRRHIGYPPLVAPIRQMIATQAVYNVLGGERYATVTQELKDYLHGLYGRPPAPVDPELRRLVIGRDEPITIRPADLLEPQVENARRQVRKLGFEPTDDLVLIHLMFPNLAPDYARGPEPAKSNGDRPVPKPVEMQADPAPAPAPAPDPPSAPPAAEFDVEVEGEVFKVRVSGAGMSVAVTAPAPAAGGNSAPAAPKAGEGTVLAPMQGLIVKIPVKPGDVVKLGDVVAVLEAMKMQNDIITTVAGKVSGIYVKEGEVVTPNQPLLNIG
jgi:pyruvate carboxylase subunit B